MEQLYNGIAAITRCFYVFMKEIKYHDFGNLIDLIINSVTNNCVWFIHCASSAMLN